MASRAAGARRCVAGARRHHRRLTRGAGSPARGGPAPVPRRARHPAAGWSVVLAGELRNQLEAALCRIAADPAVKALVLFGSRDTGEAHADAKLELTGQPWHHVCHWEHVMSGAIDIAMLKSLRKNTVAERGFPQSKADFLLISALRAAQKAG